MMELRPLKEAWNARHDPVIVDRKLDIAFLFNWLLLAAWGISTLILGQGVLAEGFDFYPAIWGGLIGSFAAASFIAGVIGFFVRPHHIPARITCKTVEMYSTTVLALTVLVYPFSMVIGFSTGVMTRFDLIPLAFTYVIFPTWRVFHMANRIQQLKKLGGARG